MVGAALTPRLARRFGSARIIWLSLVATGPVALLGPLAWPGRGVSLLVVGTTALELGQIVYAITNTSMRQRLCPPELLGRVTATMRFLMMGLFPVGALLGGVLAEVVGVRLTCLLSISIVALSAVPVRRALRHDHTVEDLPAWRADPAR
jgi:MFS-type transporter involved in bile tolerance (Atg22 family)